MIDPLADKLASYCLTDKDETFMIRTAKGLYKLKVPLHNGAVQAAFVDEYTPRLSDCTQPRVPGDTGGDW